ncbi:MAG: hypothetical protein RIC55_16060 [Pirellulaceae bacterium]
MKRTHASLCHVGCLLLLFSMGAIGRTAEPYKYPGRFHRIDLSETHAQVYELQVGDLVQCYLDFPIIPEAIVEDLELTIRGNRVRLVTVVYTSRPGIVGSGQVSAFLTPIRPGPTQLSIRPEIPGKDTKAVELQFVVKAPAAK